MITKFILLCSLALAFCRVNAQEGISIYIESPGKDTLADEVMINGILINASGKKFEYVNFYGTCDASDYTWRVWITKDSINVYKSSLVSRGDEASLLNDSIYRFQFCVNIHKLGNPWHLKEPKEGEYIVWIKYLYGDKPIVSNKLKLYFKSSKK